MNIEKEIIKLAKVLGDDLYKLEVPFPDCLDCVKSVKEITLQDFIKVSRNFIKYCKVINPDEYDIILEYCTNFMLFINSLTKDDIKLLSKDELKELENQIIEINKIQDNIYLTISSEYDNRVEEVLNDDGLENMSKEELIKYVRDHQ